MKRARPQGLGSSFKKEKVPLNVNGNLSENIDTSSSIFSSNENKKDNICTEKTEKLIYELPEDATALDQLKALFESAIMYLGNNLIIISIKYNLFVDDVEKAKPIFNGIIHECLRLESILDLECEEQSGENDSDENENDLDNILQVQKDSEKIFSHEFYFIFGESLRFLAEFEMGAKEIEESSLDQVKGLLSAAIDRFQLSTEKKLKCQDSDQEQQLDIDLKNGTLYSMASLCVLLKDNESIKSDLKKLLSGSKDDAESSNLITHVRSSMFDAVEFFCSYIETAFETEFEELESIQEICKTLENNLSLIEEVLDFSSQELKSEFMKFKLIKIDIPVRLAIAQSNKITEEDSKAFLKNLENLLIILSEEGFHNIRYEALQLKASILEIMGLEDEANLIYDEANSIELN